MPLAPRTEREYRLALKRIGFTDASSFGDPALPQVSPEQWEHLSNSGRLMLRAALRWAYSSAGLAEEGERIAQTITLRHEVKRLRDFPSREEVERFTVHIEKAKEPFASMLRVLLGMGLRAEEFLALKRNAIEASVKSGVLRFVRKGQKEADLPVSPVLSSLRALLKRRAVLNDPSADVEAPAWDVLWQVYGTTPRAAYERMKRGIARHAVQAGCELHWTPHMLRHAFATELVRDGAPLPLVQKAIGHASYQTTVKTYVHLDTKDLDVWMNRKAK